MQAQYKVYSPLTQESFCINMSQSRISFALHPNFMLGLLPFNSYIILHQCLNLNLQRHPPLSLFSFMSSTRTPTFTPNLFRHIKLLRLARNRYTTAPTSPLISFTKLNHGGLPRNHVGLEISSLRSHKRDPWDIRKWITMVRPKWMFTKNIGLCRVAKSCKGANTCLVMEGQGSW